MRLLLKAILPVLCLFCLEGRAQQVEVYKIKDLEKLLSSPDDTLYIVNFWATWCKPCIKELPYFERADSLYKGRNVKVILVSLDYVQDLDTKLKPFMKRRGLTSKVALMDEIDYNAWIDKVEPTWSGAIPVTLLFNNARKKRQFIDHELKEQELEMTINNNLN